MYTHWIGCCVRGIQRLKNVMKKTDECKYLHMKQIQLKRPW